MSAVVPGDLQVVGRLTSPYGVKGWVKVYSYTQPLDNILAYPRWYVGADARSCRPVAVAEGKRHGPGLVARIDGVSDREAAQALCGQDIFVPASDFPTLPDGEYYWHQLVGLRVYSGDALLGQVAQLMETGANDVMVVRPCTGSLDGRERLIPYLPGQYVLSVELEQKQMRVDWDPDF